MTPLTGQRHGRILSRCTEGGICMSGSIHKRGDAGYTPEQTQIVLGSKSMNTVKQYAEVDKIEIRRALMNKVISIHKDKEKSG